MNIYALSLDNYIIFKALFEKTGLSKLFRSDVGNVSSTEI